MTKNHFCVKKSASKNQCQNMSANLFLNPRISSISKFPNKFVKERKNKSVGGTWVSIQVFLQLFQHSETFKVWQTKTATNEPDNISLDIKM